MRGLTICKVSRNVMEASMTLSPECTVAMRYSRAEIRIHKFIRTKRARSTIRKQ